jgi:hypothetical protein
MVDHIPPKSLMITPITLGKFLKNKEIIYQIISKLSLAVN